MFCKYHPLILLLKMIASCISQVNGRYGQVDGRGNEPRSRRRGTRNVTRVFKTFITWKSCWSSGRYIVMKPVRCLWDSRIMPVYKTSSTRVWQQRIWTLLKHLWSIKSSVQNGIAASDWQGVESIQQWFWTLLRLVWRLLYRNSRPDLGWFY